MHAGGLQDFAGQCGQSGSRDGAGLAALLSHPKGLCVSPQGHLAVVDAGNACVRSVSMTGLHLCMACAALIMP